MIYSTEENITSPQPTELGSPGNSDLREATTCRAELIQTSSTWLPPDWGLARCMPQLPCRSSRSTFCCSVHNHEVLPKYQQKGKHAHIHEYRNTDTHAACVCVHVCALTQPCLALRPWSAARQAPPSLGLCRQA